jgi:predicted lysophospholipase L1 biosynthesis ABC-type transport system permease subunit
VERSARVASFRRIDWDSYGFNYVLVFSPNALADAPYNLAATIELGPDRTSRRCRARSCPDWCARCRPAR